MSRLDELRIECLALALMLVSCQWGATPISTGVGAQQGGSPSAEPAGEELPTPLGYTAGIASPTAESEASVWLDTAAVDSLAAGRYLSVMTDDFEGTPFGGIPDPASRFAFVSDKDLSITWVGTTSTWIQFSPDASMLAFVPKPGSAGGAPLGIMDVKSGGVRFLPAERPYTDIRQFSWGPSSKEIAVDAEMDIRILDINTFSFRTITDCADPVPDTGCYEPVWAPARSHLAYRLSIAKSGSPDPHEGTYVASLQCDEPSGQCGPPKGPFPESMHVALSPDGSIVALYQDAEVVAYSVEVSSELWSIPCTDLPAGLAWSPDGGEVAVGVENGVWLLDAESGKLLSTVDMPVVPMVLSWVTID